MILDLLEGAASGAASVMVGLIFIMLSVKIKEAWRDCKASKRSCYRPLRYRLRMLFTTKATRKAMATLQPVEDGIMEMEQRVVTQPGAYTGFRVTNAGSGYSKPPIIIINK